MAGNSDRKYAAERRKWAAYARAERAAGNDDPWCLDYDEYAGETSADASDRAEARKEEFAKRHALGVVSYRGRIGYVTQIYDYGHVDVYWTGAGQVWYVPTEGLEWIDGPHPRNPPTQTP